MRLILFLLGAVCAAAQGGETLRLAATTSAENSGLLEYLLPDFERGCGCKVRALIAGSGKALAFGRRGDVDVLLTHAPLAEKQFVADGFGVLRRAVMENDFVLVGPPADPAGAGEKPDIAAALQKIIAGEGRFVSRGDESGTHQKEKSLWKILGEKPGGARYVEAGGGMGRTLVMADELGAYTLSDRGTYIAFRDKLQNKIVLQNDPALRNPYSVTAVNPARHPHVRGALARRFVEWLTSPATQRRIGEFRYRGEILFAPAALSDG